MAHNNMKIKKTNLSVLFYKQQKASFALKHVRFNTQTVGPLKRHTDFLLQLKTLVDLL